MFKLYGLIDVGNEVRKIWLIIKLKEEYIFDNYLVNSINEIVRINIWNIVKYFFWIFSLLFLMYYILVMVLENNILNIIKFVLFVGELMMLGSK